MNINLREYIRNHKVYLDGGLGSMLQAKGVGATKEPEHLNLTHPDIIIDIHTQYFNAGSNIINTHTFGANILKYELYDLDQIIKAAVTNAYTARDNSTSTEPKWIALDIGPTGKMLAPYGDLDFEEAVSIFSTTIKLGVKYGVDLIFIETMSDSYETKAALLAAKESCDLPVFVSNSYGEDSKLLTGASPAAMIALLEGMGADAIGINCSLGPQALYNVAKEYLTYSSTPIIFKPNAGLPTVIDNKTVYDVPPEEFANSIASLVKEGISIIGGCCGTTPEYIKELVSATKDINTSSITPKNITMVSSYTHAVEFGNKPILIGERINPTGKKLFKEALRNNDINYILNEGIKQQDANVDLLDVNVGLPEIDEDQFLTNTMCALQEIINLPLQIDTSNAKALETALRRYNGKAMINSVNGKKESMDSVFPLAKKYGGLIVALVLDEDGIPNNLEDQIEIANKILTTANSYGIDKKDIIFDPLALAISADNTAATRTLKAIDYIHNTMGCHTSLGVSNVSFGLPNRDIINASFFTSACNNGLSAAIINPFSAKLMESYYSYLALAGLDNNCVSYIEFATNINSIYETPAVQTTITNTSPSTNEQYNSSLQRAIIKGLKDETSVITKELLSSTNPLDIINNEIIPALDIVGQDFENKKKYLPQLLMSAEAAKIAFDNIKHASTALTTLKKCQFAIATVQGDIHDIGKNIVKLLLENYGFDVIDLGRDVAPETIVNEVVSKHIPLVGLSALMTTTTPAMAATIEQLKLSAPWCKTIVGGAVLTKEYADSIGADYYAKDALDTVKYADSIYLSLNK